MKIVRKSPKNIQSHVRFMFCLIIFLALFAYPTSAWACSCVMPGKPDVEFAQSSAVFKGQVVNISDTQNALTALLDQVRSWTGIAPSYSYNAQEYGYQVEFTVLDSWKGVTTTTVDVMTGYGGGDCGYSFNVGTQYIVYTYSNGSNVLATSICSRTADISLATEDLNYLNSLPVITLVPVTKPLEPLWLLLIGVAIVLVILLITIFMLYRRHQTERKD